MANPKPAGKPPRRKVTIAPDGARSPNRETPTSASKRAVPIKPVKSGKANAVARAEQARAAGLIPPHTTPNPVDEVTTPTWAQAGERLTTAAGLRVDDADNSLKAGVRGPTLMDDFHLRERITHFDHERIPERVVHARGAAAHGVFEATDGLEDICAAAMFRRGAVTPTFTRFSTVAGSRGSMDTARDVRGFATKFYTTEGNFDLVGNNIPVFFIQDGLKFPDVVHAVKPEPDREIPQAQSAHDTFWDFVSLQPESTHMLMWVMSDRAIPRSYATMEGFGVHTFRLSNAKGETSLVKWHWKPVAGIHSLVWQESQKLGGIDPDYHRRDLHARVATGNFPQYELGVQVMPDTPDQTFEGIDLLDPTKIVPEELVPVRPVGTMTLNRNPDNFFAETEQVAFHPGHLVPGIAITDDPLLQARLFSYIDTQITRLGGPNFNQIPINRPLAPVNDNNRDGFHQSAVHVGTSPFTPNSTGGGCPFAKLDATAYTHPPVPMAPKPAKVKMRPASFDDHFSQATLFYRSLSDVEQLHVAQAFSFELGKCISPGVQARMVTNLANVDAALAEEVAAHLGISAPAGKVMEPTMVSEALSQTRPQDPIVAGRMVAILADEDTPARVVNAYRAGADPLGVEVIVIGPHFGKLASGLPIDRSAHISDPVEYDGVVLATAPDEVTAVFVQEAFRHHKTIGVSDPSMIDALDLPVNAAGVAQSPDDFFAALGLHRHWNR
ncbi:MAG: catalase [Actinomycetota bacterium]|jgi:catalase